MLCLTGLQLDVVISTGNVCMHVLRTVRRGRRMHSIYRQLHFAVVLTCPAGCERAIAAVTSRGRLGESETADDHRRPRPVFSSHSFDAGVIFIALRKVQRMLLSVLAICARAGVTVDGGKNVSADELESDQDPRISRYMSDENLRAGVRTPQPT